MNKCETRKFEGYFEGNNFQVEMHKILLNRGVKWEEAMRIRSQHQHDGEGFYLSHLGGQKKPSVALVHGLGRLSDGKKFHSYAIVRPNTGKMAKSMGVEELTKRFTKISDSEAKQLWEEQYKQLEQYCHHKYYFGKCKVELSGHFCESGRPTRTYFVLSGSVICIWPTLEEVITEKSSKANSNSHSKRMQIVRVRTENSSTGRIEKLVGKWVNEL